MENSNEQLMLKYNKLIKQRQEAVKRYNNKNREKITLQVKINELSKYKNDQEFREKKKQYQRERYFILKQKKLLEMEVEK